jgi:hypothetical protein
VMRGLIQMGEEQRETSRYRQDAPIEEQMEAVTKYLTAPAGPGSEHKGVKPGDSLLEIYAVINAGNRARTQASDRRGYTVERHVREMRAGPHAADADRLLSGDPGLRQRLDRYRLPRMRPQPPLKPFQAPDLPPPRAVAPDGFETFEERGPREPVRAAVDQVQPDAAAKPRPLPPVAIGAQSSWWAHEIPSALPDLPRRRPELDEPRYGRGTGTTEAEPQESVLESIMNFLRSINDIKGAMAYVSPEVNIAKMMAAAETRAAAAQHTRHYQDVGNDHRQISVEVNLHASGLEGVAAQVGEAVLGAMSTKSLSTSTGAMTDP